MGTVRVPLRVSLGPWGKDWKAALPLELQAQIDDLRTGRVRTPAAVQPAATAGGGVAATVNTANTSTPQFILDLFQAAEGNLAAVRCAE